MNLRYDVDLVEAVILLCANGQRLGVPPLQIIRFQHQRDKLYSILDPDERNAGFVRLHLEWFREWGLEASLAKGVAEFPLLADALNVLAFRKARNKADEGSELFVNPELGRNGVVALAESRFHRDESQLAAFLRHELMHLHDMVDPSFAYSRELPAGQQGATQQRLVRERYRLLWDVVIDGRLTASGRTTVAVMGQRWGEFDRAYAFWPEEKRRHIFEKLWTGASPRHDDLLSLASDPRAIEQQEGPLPGAICPLCSFPTFDWAQPLRFTAEIAEKIREAFPEWQPLNGACNRCVEIYEMSRMEYPATLCL